MKKQIFIVFLSAVLSVQLFAQTFTLSGEIRPRIEVRHGYKTMPDDSSGFAFFVNQRSRLNLLYERPEFNVFVSFQEVRTWGGKGMFETQPGLGIHQAFVELPFLSRFALKLGRQELRYDNQRLFGINNWNQAGRTHDAAVVKFSDMGWSLHLGTAYNQSIDTTFGSNYKGKEYKSLNYLWIDKKFGKINLNGIVVVDGYQKKQEPSTNYLRATYGGLATWKSRDLGIELQGYKQGGKTQTGQQIDSWYLNMTARAKPAKMLGLVAGVEWLSGNDRTKKEEKFKAFNPLYSASHIFHGHLDYFTDIPSHTDSAGLVDLFFNVIYQLTNKVTLKADYHNFSTESNLADPEGKKAKKYLGSEIDLGVQIAFSKMVDLQFGYSTMFATKSMEYVTTGSHREPIHWGWLMLTVKPVFFTTGSK